MSSSTSWEDRRGLVSCRASLRGPRAEVSDLFSFRSHLPSLSGNLDEERARYRNGSWSRENLGRAAGLSDLSMQSFGLKKAKERKTTSFGRK